MRKFKRVFALLLVLSMVLSCFSGMAAAKERPDLGAEQKDNSSAKGKGALSAEFEKTNSYRYADDEIVRAIVMLESAPEADIAGGAEKKAAHRIALLGEHQRVMRAMGSISYEMAYEFTALFNGFSCDVAYGDLEAIAEIDGVSAVHIANTYTAPILEEPQNEGSGLMMGNNISNQSGYNGKGIVVAVLDTGLRTTHEAFQVYAGMPISEILTEADITKTSVPGKYISAKIPFAYDYADGDDDVSDNVGHGTHVSGTAVGYAEAEDGAILMSGAAPAAQLVSMKIFKGEDKSTSTDIYLRALEDAYRMDVDVVNMSIGSQSGFTYDTTLETEVFGNIYKRMEEAGIVICVSAGNDCNMTINSSIGYTGPDYTDYGTVSSPATYEGNVCVASVENATYSAYYMELDGKKLPVENACLDHEDCWFQNFGGKSVEFVVLKSADGTEMLTGCNGVVNADGSNAVNHYEGIDVAGKIVVVSRGDINYEKKAQYAAEAGAIGLIVCNNQEEEIFLIVINCKIPVVSVNLDARELFMAAEENSTICTSEDKILFPRDEGWLMSAFSNWGTSPMLTIDPTITGVGGQVYSTMHTGDSDYAVKDGTSMACPNVTGTFACVLQALVEDGERQEMDKYTRATYAKALLESTGIVLFDTDDYIYSVRKQGSGLANSANAIDTYFNAAYITNPIQELGDDKAKTGIYTMELEMVNESFGDITYDNFSTYVLFDYLAKNADGIVVNTLSSDYLYIDNAGNATVSYMVDGEEVTSITLLEGEKKTITVTITLSEEAKDMLDVNFVNGTFIEGYVSFSKAVSAEEEDLWDINADTYETHATFLAYYGDWAMVPAMETLTSFDYLEARYLVNTYDLGDGQTYASLGYSPYDLLYSLGNRCYTDVNLVSGVDGDGNISSYLGSNLLDMDTTAFMSEHISFTTPESNATNQYFYGMCVMPSLLRNARHVVMTVTDAETGEVYRVEDAEYLRKNIYSYASSSWERYGQLMWDGTDADGKTYVPSGTVATVTFDVQVPYGEAEDIWQENVWSFDVTVDYLSPVIEAVVYNEKAQTLTVTARDEQYLAGIYLTDAAYSTIYGYETFSSDIKGESFTATFDVSGVSEDSVIVAALDYATNELEQVAYLFEEIKPATVTFSTPAGTEIVESVIGGEIKMPEAEAYEGYRFEGWTTAPYTMSDGSDVEAVFPSGATLTLSGPEYTFYALYSKVEQVSYDKVHYRYQTASAFEGYWAFVGFPYVSGTGYDINQPIAMGSNAEAISVSAITDAEIYQDRLEFATNYSNILYYLQYFADYDAYAIINVATGKVLTDADRTAQFMDKLYYEGLWKLQITEGGNILCYNYQVKTDILVFNDETTKFEILDDTIANGNGYYPNQWYSMYLYSAFDTAYSVAYYTTEICLHDMGSHTFGEWVETKPATCTEEGVMTLSCTKCAYSYEKIIPVTGHTAVVDPAVAPTCTSVGLTEGSHCSVCNKTLVAREVIPATGHSYTYTNKGETHEAVCGKCFDRLTEEHSYIDNTCVCGAEKVMEPVLDESINILHTLDLASDISITFAVLQSTLNNYDRYYMECVIPKYEGNTLVGSTTVQIQPVSAGSYYYFTLTGITAVQMNDMVDAVLHMTKDGQEYISKTDSYSVATYAYTALNGNSNAKILTLCADLLRYGAEAQSFKGYRTDSLVDANMTEVHRSYLSDTASLTFAATDSYLADLSNPTITWVGKTLDLGTKVGLKFVFNTKNYSGDLSNLSMKVTYVNSAGVKTTVTLTGAEVYSADSGFYSFTFYGLLASELRTIVDAAVYEGNTRLSETLRYSAETYASNTIGKTLEPLTRALFAYSDSAKAYFAK